MSGIYDLSASGRLPGTAPPLPALMPCREAAGMKISLFIMEDNQISDASLCLPAKKKEKRWGAEIEAQGVKATGL